MANYLFVYGTLLKKFESAQHQVIKDHARYVAEAYMHGRLYEIDGYPGAIASTEVCDKVWGELYEIIDQEAVFFKLDDYEACSARFPKPHEYVRQQVPIMLSKGESISAWVYLYNHDINASARILSGNYLDSMRMIVCPIAP